MPEVKDAALLALEDGAKTAWDRRLPNGKVENKQILIDQDGNRYTARVILTGIGWSND